MKLTKFSMSLSLASLSVASAWDPSLVTNCQACTAATQPDCMTLLETANSESPYFDITFAAAVSCNDLEFAFECVLLKNPAYPLGYLEYYFRLPETANNTVCETYADYWDTMACNVECVEAGTDVQEGAEEYLCEQCEESTVSACYNFLGYSSSDPDMSCDAKQLAFECLNRNFSAYPNGYLTYIEQTRGTDLTCQDIADSYSTSTCTLRCSDCPATCLFSDCNTWVSDGVNTCAGLESMGCDCSGCDLCSSSLSPAPAPDDGWIVQTTTKCGRGSLGANEVQIGANGYSYDTVDHETFDIADCKATCEASAECGGFALEYHTTETCWYVADTSLYVSASSSESCYTYVGKGNSGPHDVSWCEHCSTSTAESCFNYLTYALHNASTTCTDINTAMTCLENTDYFTTAGISCASMEAQLPSSCSIQCPGQCKANCNYQTCDALIAQTDILSCASIENAWGCDCQNCLCEGSSSSLNALGYSAVVGSPCQFSDFGSNTNRATIPSLDATFVTGKTVEECASLCDGAVVAGADCDGFSYDIINQKCTFVLNSASLGSASGEYICLARTNDLQAASTTAATTTDSISNSGTTADVGAVTDPEDNGVIIGVAVAVAVVVAGVIAIVVWRVKSNADVGGFTPQNKERPTTYAAPSTPGSTLSSTRRDDLKSIDEDKQIDQDGFEL